MKYLSNMYSSPFTFLKYMNTNVLLPDGNGSAKAPGSEEEQMSLYYDPIELE